MSPIKLLTSFEQTQSSNSMMHIGIYVPRCTRTSVVYGRALLIGLRSKAILLQRDLIGAENKSVIPRGRI